MSARLPAPHQGNQSIEKRSGSVKSYRALLSTEIRRRFPGLDSNPQEAKSLNSLIQCEKKLVTTNNNKRASLVNRPKALAQSLVKKCCTSKQLIER